MTCIVALRDKKGIVIGGDCCASNGCIKRARRDHKVFKKGHYLMGFTTSFRMGQLLQHLFEPPVYRAGDLHEFMVKEFVEAVRALFKAHGFSSGCFLVGYKRRIFRIDEDHQVGESLENFDACGSGEAFALGAMSILSGLPLSSEQKVKRALQAAARHCPSVEGPFRLLNNYQRP